MKRLPLPGFDVKHAVELCASGITIPERAQALMNALPAIQSAESTYLHMAPTAQLYLIPTSDGVTPQLTGDLMGVVYKSHFMRAGSPSRGLYDAIRVAPPYNLCPLCGQRTVASVDHYLPQSLHPVFNLTPANLVPACSDCNKNKLAKLAQSAEQQTLHPYFDDLGSERWLVVDVRETTPPGVAFRVRPAQAWSAVLAQRVQHHFEVMDLAELYAAQGASELADISSGLVKLGLTGGGAAVRAHLEGEFASRFERDANSWKTALYEGLCTSDWFCDEGYRLIR
ncbi:HNH endonuclease [Roseateles cellulosilyticus]|uniref:HNH endonuclease n=1 Tax=Pelomonas cellulosilytica TaxID=2906762 RepID=A0ABS8XUQ6_9BURK|nr:HNH endonuclease [Pelomonas sp. P8]MCE4555025.1 HNH endonuclease [Pelomonas sp. P8]